MLRSLYRCAVRLHPPAFRSHFADEMLSIFDRAHGTAAGLKLIVDALFSLARQWALRPEFWHEIPSATSPETASDGIPSFYTISPFRPRGAAFVNGLAVSLAVFCLTCFAIRYSWIHVLHVRIPEVQFERPSWIPPRAVTSGQSPSTPKTLLLFSRRNQQPQVPARSRKFRHRLPLSVDTCERWPHRGRMLLELNRTPKQILKREQPLKPKRGCNCTRGRT